MPYETIAIANNLIDLAALTGRKLTSIRLQKLIYYAHGWHLAIDKTPLIEETIEARPHGIVVPSVFNGFKEFGIRHLEGHLTEFDSDANNWSAPKVSVDDGIVCALLDKVWRTYEVLDTNQLCNLTHMPGTPWQLTRERANSEQPFPHMKDDLLLDCFASIVKKAKMPAEYNYFNIRIPDIRLEATSVDSKPDELTLLEYAVYEQEARKLHSRSRKDTWKRVSNFGLSWDTSARMGWLFIHLQDGVKYDIRLNSSQEFEAVRKTVRGEKVLFYNIVTGAVALGWQQVAGSMEPTEFLQFLQQRNQVSSVQDR